MKKVLIITYYWPPSGGGGVQRWLKFSKYFREFGWEPVIYTPENPEMPAVDESLMKDIPEGLTILKQPVWEPYSLYKNFTGKKKSQSINTGFLSESKKPKMTENLAVWIRGNFFIPDARKFWIKPSIKFLKKYLNENPVDAIVSTGPPHSMHMIALGLKKSLNIPWIADFRDPWTNIDFYHKLKLSSFADKSHHRKEKQVIQNADILTTVSWSWAEDFKQLGAKNIEVITNGFDPGDFESIDVKASGKFELCHLGSMNKDRNPERLWDALSEVADRIDGFKEDLKITLLGSTDHQVFDDLDRNHLSNHIEHLKYLPHNEVLERAARSTVLLLPLNNTPNVSGIIPGKIFEYLALQKPILCIGPDSGDSARIIRETKSGKTFGFDAKKDLVKLITDYYLEFKDHKTVELKKTEFQVYSRKILTGRMASVLNAIT